MSEIFLTEWLSWLLQGRSVDGDRGRGLSVYLHGDKCGKWIDFATGDSGDMLDLIQQSRNVSLTEAMDWGAKRYSIREFSAKPKISPAGKKKYVLPTPPPQSNNAYIHEYMESRGFRDVGTLRTRFMRRSHGVVWMGVSVPVRRQARFHQEQAYQLRRASDAQKDTRPIRTGGTPC